MRMEITLLIILIQLIEASLINEIITPTKTEIKLDASDMIEILPNQTTIGATIMLNPNGAQNIEDFIYLEHPITAV